MFTLCVPRFSLRTSVSTHKHLKHTCLCRLETQLPLDVGVLKGLETCPGCVCCLDAE